MRARTMRKMRIRAASRMGYLMSRPESMIPKPTAKAAKHRYTAAKVSPSTGHLTSMTGMMTEGLKVTLYW